MKKNQKKNTISRHVELYKICISVSIDKVAWERSHAHHVPLVCRGCFPAATTESWQRSDGPGHTKKPRAGGLPALGHCPQQKGAASRPQTLSGAPKPGGEARSRSLLPSSAFPFSACLLSISCVPVTGDTRRVGCCSCLGMTGQLEGRRTQKQEAGHFSGGS